MTALSLYFSQDDMNSLRQKRLGKFSEAKLSILGMLEQLEAEPDSSFERNVVCEEDEAFVLSADNLDAVEVRMRIFCTRNFLLFALLALQGIVDSFQNLSMQTWNNSLKQMHNFSR